MRKRISSLGTVLAVFALAVATPVAAQFYSDGYKFLEAVKKKDGDTATSMLDEPGSTIVNARDITTGETGLHIAVARRDLLWVQFLLQRKANPNIADGNGVTPLVLACQLGFIDGVQALVDKGANVDISNRAGETPLIAAVHKKDIPLVRVLLKAGADPDRTDNSGRSARDYASLPGMGTQLMAAIEEDAKPAGEREGSAYGPSF